MTVSTISDKISHLASTEKALPNDSSTYRVYTKRWFILGVFAMTMAVNSYQWIQYTIIINIIKKFYNISETMVNNTSVVYLITFLPLIIPATYIIEKKGIRFAIILAAIGNFIGSWLKVPSAASDRFYLGFIGQTFLSIAQLFILNIPPKLAGVWFGPDQLSTACAIGVFGSQLGPALGFFFTPLAVKDSDDMQVIGQELFYMFLVMAIITSVILLATLLFFSDKPPSPPSKGQETASQVEVHIWKSYRTMLTNKPYIIFLVAYGINIGLFNTISTLLSELIEPHFPENGAEFAGRIGVLIVATGSFSSIILGILLDKTKAYKGVTVIIYLLTAFGMFAFTAATYFESKIAVYFSSFILGFFMSGYMAVGYELATEFTYPEPEYISSGILMSVSQTTGVIFTIFFQQYLNAFGDLISNLTMAAMFVTGGIITLLTPNIVKRQDMLHAT